MQISFQAFGTYNQIMAEVDCLPLLEECRSLCEAIEAKFSAFQPTSAIAEISAQAGIRRQRFQVGAPRGRTKIGIGRSPDEPDQYF